jgi:hypothetical protein
MLPGIGLSAWWQVPADTGLHEDVQYAEIGDPENMDIFVGIPIVLF